MAIKFTQDALVDAGLVVDDNKKFIKAVRIEPATDIPKDKLCHFSRGKNNPQINLHISIIFFFFD